jgi:glyoxylase-like metal-dependent hydrolase (beta-lactamase superfamily II)
MERPDYGAAVELEPGLRLVLAPNPSPMTHWGTNTYLVGFGSLVVVDPGPDDPAHLAALRAAIGGARVAAVLVTHPHRDHSPLAPRLARACGAPVIGFGPPEAGRRPIMAALAEAGEVGGGEGVDAGFRPDELVAGGAGFAAGEVEIGVLHTPGHFSGHLSFVLGDAVLTGDHVMGWASTLVSPPDGDLASFLATSAALRARSDRVFYPGHGAPLRDTAGRLDWLLSHRRSRETTILEALGDASRTVDEITRAVYRDVPPEMLPAAGRNVLAHLIDLVEKGMVRAEPALAVSAQFRRI